ncbi:MAG: hypothetical protein ACREV6_02435 [Clostridium sp.]
MSDIKNEKEIVVEEITFEDLEEIEQVITANMSIVSGNANSNFC